MADNSEVLDRIANALERIALALEVHPEIRRGLEYLETAPLPPDPGNDGYMDRKARSYRAGWVTIR